VETGTVGNGGNITIDSGSFSLRDGAQLEADTLGQGNAGNVTVQVRDSVSVANGGGISSRVQASAVGKGGNIDINAATLSLTDGAQLITRTGRASDTQPAGRGDAGNININVTGAIDIAGKTGTTPVGFSAIWERGHLAMAVILLSMLVPCHYEMALNFLLTLMDKGMPEM
jgi:large exoprotein involved in heme utilization and adhesion